MKVFLTGGTGFIGGRLASRLAERGDTVVALVRDRARAESLLSLGCGLVEGDLHGDHRDAMAGCDSVIHNAAVYKVGIAKKDRPAMYRSNVEGTEKIVETAIAAGVPKVVYISTVNAFGNTKGNVVDETYERDEADGYVSYYDETKYLAHRWVKTKVDAGAPIVIVQPGLVYGPGDHSEVGTLIDQVSTGKLKFRIFPETGFTYVYIDDAATGIIKAHDKGRLGESYVIGGQIGKSSDMMDAVARLSGRKPPSIPMPPAMLKASAPLGPMIGPLMGFPPNLRELISAAHGVTYWARDDKARSELGHTSRTLKEGLEQTLSLM